MNCLNSPRQIRTAVTGSKGPYA